MTNAGWIAVGYGITVLAVVCTTLGVLWNIGRKDRS